MKKVRQKLWHLRNRIVQLERRSLMPITDDPLSILLFDDNGKCYSEKLIVKTITPTSIEFEKKYILNLK